MIKYTILFFATLISFQFSFAQKTILTGTLCDSADHQITLNFATVSVFKGTDSVLHTYKLSNDKGVFSVNLESGLHYRLLINAWMYEVYRKDIFIDGSQSSIDIGKIYLSEKTNMLNEVLIQSELPPILVRNDTIEFNAGSFKTLPSAVVEDLLKKLPGVSIDGQGEITVNGKVVSKILVDGKEFFGGDQQIATKNLPADIIDKVQVSDDQESKRRDPDILAGNTPQIINLKLKKTIKSGAFGKLYGGAGPQDLFETGGIMNFFRDTTQLSVLGYGNNVNKSGFNMSDIMRIGGFSRSGANSWIINNDHINIGGISFGGAASGGIQTSSGAGANFNTLTEKGIKINGKYFLSHSKASINELTATEQILGEQFLYVNKNSRQTDKSYGHHFGGRLETKLDSLTKLIIEPNVSISLPQSNENLKTQTLNSDKAPLNDGSNIRKTNGTNTEYKISMSLWKDFIKTGRSLNISARLNRKDNLNNNYNTVSNQYYDPISDSSFDQWRNNDIHNFDANLNANYNEPLSKALSLNMVLNGTQLDNKNALATFLRNPDNQAYDIAVPSLTETVTQSGFKTNNRISLRWKVNKNLNIQPGFVFNSIDLQNKFSTYTNFGQHFTFFAPQLTVKYKNLNISYSPSFKEPDVRYIQPVANNSDPLFIENGNPNLRPSKTHQVNLNLYKYDTQRTLNYSVYLGGSVENDGIISAREIDQNGVQMTTPTNQNGIWRFHNNGRISKDFKTLKRQFTLTTGYWGNYNKGIVMVNRVKSESRIVQGGVSLGGRINLNDKFELGETYRINLNKSSYSDDFFTDLSYYRHSSETEIILRWPKKVVWETTYRWQYNTQTITGIDNRLVFWDAAVNFLFLKNDRLQLKCSFNNILKANSDRYVYISENVARDVRTNNLGQYGLFTLTYNIQNFGKVGGQDTFFKF